MLSLLLYCIFMTMEHYNLISKKIFLIFSFQHQMSLVRDASLFTQRVRRAPISGNIDNPEGGLDALMQVFITTYSNRCLQWNKAKSNKCVNQVIVCDDKIGWRQESRRVVVYTTDQVNDEDPRVVWWITQLD